LTATELAGDGVATAPSRVSGCATLTALETVKRAVNCCVCELVRVGEAGATLFAVFRIDGVER